MIRVVCFIVFGLTAIVRLNNKSDLYSVIRVVSYSYFWILV